MGAPSREPGVLGKLHWEQLPGGRWKARAHVTTAGGETKHLSNQGTEQGAIRQELRAKASGLAFAGLAWSPGTTLAACLDKVEDRTRDRQRMQTIEPQSADRERVRNDARPRTGNREPGTA